MKPFGRKPARTSPARLLPANGSGRLQTTSRRLTLDLARAETFASMLASSRSSQVIEVSDLLAGMYICNWERLSVYWLEENREEIESFLRGICRISPERWHSWIQDYDTSRRKGERSRLWRSLAKFNKTPPSEPALRPSAALATVLKHAEEIAPTRDSVGDGHLPILTSECVLLCIVRSFGSEVSRKLVHAGLDAERLERDVLFPRRAPLS
jgi:hypothetical protein